ncbi:MAG TPA: hypothetical protein VH394_05705 [Thermoanaerobaculia bacterium]|jgi:hypothetical protein|nr:hypothetical protein [Thermoanaerobaculia bacterium]
MKRSVSLGVVAALLALAIPVGASTFVALNRAELVAQSDAVVQGEVIKVESFWTPSGRLIQTEAQVRVIETIAGQAPSVLVMRTFGGTVQGYTVEAHGFPTFKTGDRLLLFVQNQQDGIAEVTGYRQGQYRVVRDRAGVDFAVPTVEAGVRLLTPDGKEAARPQAVRLDTLKNEIRAIAERGGRIAN